MKQPPQAARPSLVTRPLMLLGVVLSVVAAALVLKPSDDALAWERLKATHEIGLSTKNLDSASRLKALSFVPGRYRYQNAKHGRTLSATFHFPQGVSAEGKTDFTYTVIYTSPREQRREQVAGQARIQGHVLELYPTQAAWTLFFPRDRSLIRQASPKQFTLVFSEKPDSLDKKDMTVFTRLP